MTGSLVSLCWVCLMAAAVLGQAKHRLEGATFGSKSSYFPVANLDDSPVTDLAEVAGCQPVMLWMYVRHGTRNPGDEDILEAGAVLPALRDELIATWQQGKSGLAEEEVVQLRNWEMTLQPEDDKMLTESGRLELLQMGQRMKNRLSGLFSDASSIEARSSYKSRAIESGNNFLKAVVGQDETMIPLAVEPIATYYKQCARYEWEVDENPETEAELLKLKASQAWADMIARVNNRTGVEMDAKKVDLVYDQCRFELAFYPELYNNTFPPWCSVFTLADLELFDFASDLKNYYSDGDGYEITGKMTQPVFQELFTKIDEHISGMVSNSSVILNFGHSSGLKPILTALRMFKDEDPLLASDWPDKKDHKWHMATIAGFANNIGFLQLQCEEGQENKIMLLHNEKPVENPACGELVCSVEDFKDAYQEIADLSFEEECAWDIPTATEGTPSNPGNDDGGNDDGDNNDNDDDDDDDNDDDDNDDDDDDNDDEDSEENSSEESDEDDD